MVSTLKEAKDRLKQLGFSDQERGVIVGLLQLKELDFEIFDDTEESVKATLRLIISMKSSNAPAVPPPSIPPPSSSLPPTSSYPTFPHPFTASPPVSYPSPFTAPFGSPFTTGNPMGAFPYPAPALNPYLTPALNPYPTPILTPARTTVVVPPYGRGTENTYNDDEPLEPVVLSQNPPTYDSLDPKIAVSTKTYVPAVGHKISKNLLSMVSLKAPAVGNAQAVTSLDLVLLIDISGSMSGNKISLVKDAMKFVINHLTSKDRVSIVTFESNAHKLSPLTVLNEVGKEKLQQIVNGISSSGGTMISNGLDVAIKTLQNRRYIENIACILLLSDGQDGDAHKVRNMPIPFQTHTFGFGGDHDAQLLGDIATKTDGVFCFVESLNEVSPAFANCVGGLTSMFAKKIQVKVQAKGDYRILNWQTRFQSSINPNGTEGQVLIPDIYSEEARDLILNLQIPVLPNPKEADDILRVTVEYDPTVGNQSRVTLDPVSLLLSRPEQEPADQSVDLSLDKQNNRVVSVNSIQMATNLCEQNKFQDAQKLLKNAIDQIKASKTGKEPFCVALIGDLEACSSRLVDHNSFESAGRAYAQQQAHQHSAQRANYSPFSTTTALYQNAQAQGWVQSSKGP